MKNDVMLDLTFSQLSQDNFNQIVKLNEKGVVLDKWHQMQSECTVQEKEQNHLIQSHLNTCRLTLMNEATIWARAIYPNGFWGGRTRRFAPTHLVGANLRVRPFLRRSKPHYF